MGHSPVAWEVARAAPPRGETQQVAAEAGSGFPRPTQDGLRVFTVLGKLRPAVPLACVCKPLLGARVFLSAAHVPWSSAIQSPCRSRVASTCHSTFLLPAPVSVTESVPPTSGPGQRSWPLPTPHLLHSLSPPCEPHMRDAEHVSYPGQSCLAGCLATRGPINSHPIRAQSLGRPKAFPTREGPCCVSASVGHRLQLPSQTPASVRQQGVSQARGKLMAGRL